MINLFSEIGQRLGLQKSEKKKIEEPKENANPSLSQQVEALYQEVEGLHDQLNDQIRRHEESGEASEVYFLRKLQAKISPDQLGFLNAASITEASLMTMLAVKLISIDVSGMNLSNEAFAAVSVVKMLFLLTPLLGYLSGQDRARNYLQKVTKEIDARLLWNKAKQVIQEEQLQDTAKAITDVQLPDEVVSTEDAVPEYSQAALPSLRELLKGTYNG
jgi:hypothetical protein